MQAKLAVETESAHKTNPEVVGKRRLRRVVFIVLTAVVLLGGGLLGLLSRYSSEPTATLGSRTIRLEVVNTPELRERGLSGRRGMSEGQGMLFVFDAPGPYCFWMKDMHFPIDIIWMDAQKRVVKIEKNAQPASYPDSFCPEAHALYVLEVTAGMADKSGLKVGDQVRTRSTRPYAIMGI